jgi:hypothetical protein
LADWKSILKADPTDWLLQQAGPLDRFYILREIVERPKDDPEVRHLRDSLVDEILGQQLENGSWNNNVYNYEKGTTHQLMKLMELGLTAQDEHVKKGVKYILGFQAENGSFVQGRPSCGVEANLVMTNAAVLALARTGYADHPGVGRAYVWLCSWQQEDGSWLSPRAKRSREEGEGHPYPYCGLHATCNVLLGLSATEQGRTSEAARRGADFLLSLYGHIFKNGERIPFGGAWLDPRCVPPEWGEMPDEVVEVETILEALGSLSMLGYGLEDEKIGKGLNRLIELQAADGRWNYPRLELTCKETLFALMIIKSLYQPLSTFSFHGH